MNIFYGILFSCSKSFDNNIFGNKLNTNIEFNIPNSLKLEGIADINFTTNNLTSEDYLNSNQKPNQGETHAPLGNIIYDDINFDYQTPVDFLKNYNVYII